MAKSDLWGADDQRLCAGEAGILLPGLYISPALSFSKTFSFLMVPFLVSWPSHRQSHRHTHQNSVHIRKKDVVFVFLGLGFVCKVRISVSIHFLYILSLSLSLCVCALICHGVNTCVCVHSLSWYGYRGAGSLLPCQSQGWNSDHQSGEQDFYPLLSLTSPGFIFLYG